jgi:hypothetical protein
MDLSGFTIVNPDTFDREYDVAAAAHPGDDAAIRRRLVALGVIVESDDVSKDVQAIAAAMDAAAVAEHIQKAEARPRVAVETPDISTLNGERKARAMRLLEEAKAAQAGTTKKEQKEADPAPQVDTPAATPPAGFSSTLPDLGQREKPEEDDKLRQHDNTVCPHCGNIVQGSWSVPDPSMEDKQAWVRCLASGQTFSRQFSLYDGAVKITLRTLTGDERRAAASAALAHVKNIQISEGNRALWGQALITQQTTLELMFGLVSIDAGDEAGYRSAYPPNKRVTMTDEQLNKSVAEFISNLTAEQLSLLYQENSTFIQMVNHLRSLARKKSFFEKTPPSA